MIYILELNTTISIIDTVADYSIKNYMLLKYHPYENITFYSN